MVAATPRRFDVLVVNLDPSVGSEIRKTRPCLVISLVRPVDRRRLVKRLGTIGDGAGREVTEVLGQMFALG